MIHHLSIPAKNPEHVAKVLAELIGGVAGPFVGPIPGAWVAYAGDDVGTGFEVYPDHTSLRPPPEGKTMATIGSDADPAAQFPFHALVSVNCDRATIERIGAREGWRTVHDWRGPSPEVRLFELYEFWIENRVMLELATEDMIPNYLNTVRPERQRELRAKKPR